MNLIETLTAQTQTLRTQYLEKTAEYAVEAFASLETLSATTHPAWNDYVKPASEMPMTTSRYGRSYRMQDYEGQKRYNKACDARRSAIRTVEAGFTAFAQKLEALAVRHYEDSIIKLAARIEKKGLDKKSLTIKTGHVGVNIETVLTDGVKTVRAWTIIASGPCVRPHYRYLIK